MDKISDKIPEKNVGKRSVPHGVTFRGEGSRGALSCGEIGGHDGSPSARSKSEVKSSEVKSGQKAEIRSPPAAKRKLTATQKRRALKPVKSAKPAG
jgi:hypothetical protein